jgi:hypothetical protein
MKIQLGKDIAIDGEGNYWVVRVKAVPKGNAKPKWVNDGYFSQLENACRHVLTIKAGLSQSVHKDIQSAVSELRSLWDDIHSHTEAKRR